MDSVKSIAFAVKEMALSLTGETITTLMHRLDSEHNWNLFYLIYFLSNYHSSNIYQSHKDYQEFMNCYGKIVQKTNYESYKNKVDGEPKKFRMEYTEKFFEYTQIINKFNRLPNYEQKNIINLAWSILYCKKFKLDSPEEYIWKHYSNLIEAIKSLLIIEQI